MLGEANSKEVSAWEKHRNELCATIDWQFTTENARVKLKKLYPSIKIQEGQN
jgi:hypothetical protein